MRNAKQFKGTNIFISEDLILARRQLLKDARAAFGGKFAWTFNGRVYVRHSGKNLELHNHNDITQILN